MPLLGNSGTLVSLLGIMFDAVCLFVLPPLCSVSCLIFILRLSLEIIVDVSHLRTVRMVQERFCFYIVCKYRIM